MKKRYILIMPGEFISRRVNPNYTTFSNYAAREIKKGNNKLRLTARILPVCEYVAALIIGLTVGVFKLMWPAGIVGAGYLIAILIDPWLWRRVYGWDWAGDYKLSLLVNLDVIYWFAIGLIMGWLIL